MNYSRRIVELMIMEKQPVTSRSIAMYLNVSQRSVSSYISQINAKKTIIFAVNKGYVSHKKQLFDYLENSRDEISVDKRQEAITIKLLVADAPSNLFDMADEFFVSESTLLSAVSEINKAYSNLGIRVVRSGDDLVIHGSDENRRQLLRKMMSTYQSSDLVTLQDVYTYFKPSTMVDNVIQSIREVRDQFHLQVDDFLYVSFVIHCCIAIYSNYASSDTKQNVLSKYQDDDEHVVFINRLETHCEIKLNDSNVNYILNQFDFTFYGHIARDISQNQKKVIDQAFERVNEKFGIDLSSQSRSNSVDLHIIAMIERSVSNKKIFCPMTEAIKRNHMILFEVGIFIASELEREFNLVDKITEHEIALLTIHINNIMSDTRNRKLIVALVIPDRIKSTQKFTDFFQQSFGSELIVATVANSYDTIPNAQFDLVFSLTDSEKTIYPEDIQLDIFDFKKNISIVSDSIDAFHKKESLAFIRPLIPQLFETDLFFNNIDVEFSDKFEILGFLSDILIKKHYIDDVGKESIFEREKKASTRFGNIAIPHEFNLSATETKICVLKSEKGFVWDNGIVNLVILIVIKRSDRKFFHHFLTAITKLFDDEPMDLISSKQFEYQDFIEYLEI